MSKAIIFLAQGFEEVEATVPMDLLRRAGIELTVVGITGKEVSGSHAITYIADITIDQLSGDFDAVIVPGGMPGAANVAVNPKAMSLIQEFHGQNKLVAAICAAPVVVLEKAGVLKQKKAVCFPGMESQFVDAEFLDQKVVVDGNIITSKGVGTAFDFSLALIAYLEGDDKASAVSKKIVYQS
ncbi:MAG: DJ-1/PfpI family protein [Spirochaetales bacterium]|nr:DJ-1/PfpI family protein [Spirochaetales bacterium]